MTNNEQGMSAPSDSDGLMIMTKEPEVILC